MKAEATTAGIDPRPGVGAWLKAPQVWAYTGTAAFLIALPFLLPGLSISLVQKVLIFALLALSLDLIYGYAGLPSLGQAAFFGVGGYTVGVLMLKGGIESLWIVMPLGVIAGAVVAALFGLVALRTSGLTFLLITFALGQLLGAIALQWPFLHSYGVEALVGISFPELGFGFTWAEHSIYYAVLAIFVIGYLIALWVTRSPLGYAVRGIRENEERMDVLGYNTWWCKYKLFIISGALAAAAGQLFAFTSGTVVPTNLDITYSALAFLMVVLGGAGRIYGAVIGAAVIIVLEYYVSLELAARWPLVLGAVFVLTAVVSRHGLVGLINQVVNSAGWLRTSRER